VAVIAVWGRRFFSSFAFYYLLCKLLKFPGESNTILFLWVKGKKERPSANLMA
jgi:hypothetical protein